MVEQFESSLEETKLYLNGNVALDTELEDLCDLEEFLSQNSRSNQIRANLYDRSNHYSRIDTWVSTGETSLMKKYAVSEEGYKDELKDESIIHYLREKLGLTKGRETVEIDDIERFIRKNIDIEAIELHKEGMSYELAAKLEDPPDRGLLSNLGKQEKYLTIGFIGPKETSEIQY